MSGDACVVFDDRLTEYDFGPSHPMSPIRIKLTIRLAEALGVLGPDGLETVAAPVADDDLVATVHTAEYMAAVRRCGDEPGRPDHAHGLGTDDTPTFPRMHQASAHIVGASVEAARQVWEGGRTHAANVAGGLHHAMPAAASGFCVYNDAAVAIRWLLDHGAERVAYVDIDAHHGDGVQKVFYDDPRVLTVSLHESPRTLFPGTGYPTEIGGGQAPGTAVNLALPPGTSDAGWLRAFHAIVPEVVQEFRPQVLVTQHGCDSHTEDPLTHLMVSVDAQRAAAIALHDLSHRVCDGKWVALGGGGYAVVAAVPRVWTHLLAVVRGAPLDPGLAVPESWQEYVLEVLGTRGPSRMTDGREPTYSDWSQGYDPASWLDRSIQSTRQAVFPALGLDALFW